MLACFIIIGRGSLGSSLSLVEGRPTIGRPGVAHGCDGYGPKDGIMNLMKL